MKKTLLFFFLLPLVVCAQNDIHKKSNSKGTQVDGKWKTLKEANYTIQYPAAWELDQSGQMGTSFILLAPLASPDDNFRSNVNLIIQDLGGQPITLDEYTELSEHQVKTMMAHSNLLESKRIKTKSYEYHKLVYTSDQDIFHLQFEQYYFIVNGKAYVLTLTCEQDRFEQYKAVGEKILGGFRVKG